MSISVYQKPNKKWKADVELNGLRKTKTFDKKIDATNWGRSAIESLASVLISISMRSYAELHGCHIRH
ncbi:hypothetical protein [uncultured Acinetobacter sp.]|uniref:hypothetical protein n=1 Tax=uncultured Acinetobacter sp. TaxID=165433 RepID=UPI00258600E3|nr:hypothetical protein [uncultured Acinetobacter sp.]